MEEGGGKLHATLKTKRVHEWASPKPVVSGVEAGPVGSLDSWWPNDSFQMGTRHSVPSTQSFSSIFLGEYVCKFVESLDHASPHRGSSSMTNPLGSPLQAFSFLLFSHSECFDFMKKLMFKVSAKQFLSRIFQLSHFKPRFKTSQRSCSWLPCGA